MWSVQAGRRSVTMWSALLVVGCLAAAAAAAGNYCPDDWLLFNHNCYRRSQNYSSGTAQAAVCQALSAGARPASVHSLFENTALVSLLGDEYGWIGLRRNVSVNHTFGWSDGSPLDYEHWDRGPDPGHDCAVLDYIHRVVSGHWYVWPCEEQLQVLCEQPATRCPPGWLLYSGRCFVYNNTWIHADEQYNACRAMRIESAPASVPDMDTNLFLASLLDAQSSAWVGLRRNGVQPDQLGSRVGHWLWLDGAPNVFTNWYLSPRNDDIFANMYPGDDGAWHAYGPCDNVDGFFCQITLRD